MLTTDKVMCASKMKAYIDFTFTLIRAAPALPPTPNTYHLIISPKHYHCVSEVNQRPCSFIHP